MAAQLKLSVTISLAALLAVGAILTYYFIAVGSSTTGNFLFKGVDEDGNTITVASVKSKDSAGNVKHVIDYEVVQNPTDATGWTAYRSAWNYDTDAAFYFYSINAGDTDWTCTKLDNQNNKYVTATGGATSFSSFGTDAFETAGTDGVYYIQQSVQDADGNDVFNQVIAVALSKGGISNFGGFAVTSFKFGYTSSNDDLDLSTISKVPLTYHYASCTYEGSNSFQDDAAVVESDAAPNCSTFQSLFAFLQKKSYADNAAVTYCAGGAQQAVCTATIAKSDTVLAWKGTDRAFSCTNPTYGTILTVSGSDDITDWLKNLTITTQKFNGLTTHNGFLSKYNIWASQYASWIGTATKITFNGHSLGGAVSTIAAVAKKTASPAATVQIITCGCPAAFKTPHTATFTGLVHKRHVNFEKKTILPNQRDVVSVVTTVAGFSHASTHKILSQTLKSGKWSNAATSVTAVIGDVQISLHSQYTTSVDAIAAAY